MNDLEYQERIHEMMTNFKDGKDMSDLTNQQLVIVMMNIIMSVGHSRISILFNFDDMLSTIKDTLDYAGARYRIANRGDLPPTIYIYKFKSHSVYKTIGIIDEVFGSTMNISREQSKYSIEFKQ